MLLTPSCGWILKLGCLLSIFQYTRLAAGNLSFLSQKVALQLKVVVFRWLPESGLFPVCVPCLLQLTLTAALQGQRADGTVWGGVGFAFRVLGCPQVKWGNPWLRFSQQCVGRLVAGVQNAVQQEWCSLNALWYSYLLLSCSSPAPVMGLSLQSSGRERRFCSSTLHSWRAGHSLTAFSAGEIPGVPHLSAVLP